MEEHKSKADRLPFALLFIALGGSILYPIFISILRNIPFSEHFNILYIIVPVLPILTYFYFSKKSNEARSDLQKEVEKNDLTEPEITRIIDKYSGAVDGVGTALPLFGAAILLAVVALGDIKSSTNDAYIQTYFMNLAVPFEVVSIIILAAAKLYESVFDELSLFFQRIVDKANLERENDHRVALLTAINNIDSNGREINVRQIDKEEYASMEKVGNLFIQIQSGLKDEKLNETLDKILLILGKNYVKPPKPNE